MNNTRRALLSRAQDALGTAESLVSQALEEEQENLYNVPESFTEKYEKMETAVEQMEEAVEHITSAVEALDAAAE